MKTQDMLAYIYTFGYFSFLGMAAFHGFEPSSKDLMNTLVGILSAAQIAIVQYYFGSSQGSAQKTDLLKPKP